MECGNYCGIKLLGHGPKILEKILDKRIHAMIEIDPQQLGFIAEKITIDAIFIVRQKVGKELKVTCQYSVVFLPICKTNADQLVFTKLTPIR